MNKIGIRREDINKWERRVPLVPEHIREMVSKDRIEFVVQPSEIRVYSDSQYVNAGARVAEDLTECPVVLGIKEIPMDVFSENTAYMFFSHTIKGQEYNMPMLRKMIEKNCTLIDYERIVDEHKRRIIFFGKFAGNAGMIDSLHALGQRLKQEKITSPFSAIKQTLDYKNLIEAEKAVYNVGREISKNGLPVEICPFVIGFCGYGNVSKGAQEVCNELPIREISPEELLTLRKSEKIDRYHIYKVVFKEQDMVLPKDPSKAFDLQHYYKHPEEYKANFHQYVDHINILMNCIYWEERYPRLLANEYTAKLFSTGEQPNLRVIGDISCDIHGAIECTVMATKPDKPVFTYLPDRKEAVYGVKGNGPVVMAVNNLPCEIPAESSTAFSSNLMDFIPELAAADFSGTFEDLALSKPVKDAVVLFNGKFTANFEYMKEFI